MHTVLLSLAALLGAIPERVEWTVDGAAREALVAAPDTKSAEGAPVVFVFHGHFGTMKGANREFHLHEVWPEAIVVYPQGLRTPSPVDREGRGFGWQRTPGNQADRDLKFFDAMLATFHEKWTVDDSRVYATGHSNGGAFTYLLWATRPELLAAVVPCAAPKTDITLAHPLPAMHIAGQQDRIATFATQEQMMAMARRADGCADTGQEWAKLCTLYPSKFDTPFVAYVHPGGHIVPKEAPQLIVRFCKEHVKKSAAQAGK
ncbi:MAG TPA: hypothetical protein VGG64_17725 [Pirellulales bacterium]